MSNGFNIAILVSLAGVVGMGVTGLGQMYLISEQRRMPYRMLTAINQQRQAYQAQHNRDIPLKLQLQVTVLEKTLSLGCLNCALTNTMADLKNCLSPNQAQWTAEQKEGFSWLDGTLSALKDKTKAPGVICHEIKHDLIDFCRATSKVATNTISKPRLDEGRTH